jgi:hypothetical protein
MGLDPGKGIDITSRTSVVGMLNGEPYEGEIFAKFHTVIGGSSRCTFTKLPDAITPAAINTHT